jgi:hypothetical protein
LTLARNGVTSSFTVPASGALSTNLYLGAINNNGIALGSSPYNIEYASVGTGLTNTEVTTYTSLVYNFRNNFRGYDRDAVNFINALGTARSYLTLAQQSSISTLVSSLKSANLWDKFQVMYPFIGGTATSHGFNLKDPRQVSDAYYMTFNAGTHNALGYAASSGQRGTTNFNPLRNLTNVSSSHISLYIPVLTTGDGYDLGDSPFNANYFGFAIRGPYNEISYGAGGVRLTMARNSVYGYLVGTRNQSNIQLNYYTGSQIISSSTTNTTYGLQDNTLFLGSNDYFVTTRTYSFLTIGSGLTNAESIQLNNIIQTYQAALGRQAI